MKKKTSRILLLTSLAIVFLSMVSGLVINLLTSDTNFTEWLKDNNIGTGKLVFGVTATGIALLIFTYFQFRYTEKIEETTEKEALKENIEPDIKRLFESLKERYQNRYQSKLDGRFEITLEVSEDFDSSPRSITEQFEGNATKGEAIEVIRQAFEQKGRLLIAGNAGVGKTVLLLKLAIDLLDKIEDLEKEPFPIIFNLASWSEEYENFGDWLKAMLVSGYGFSRDFAEKFLRQERIIFLLDGLDELARNETDEIAAEKRAACLASLNDYLSGERKAVICSRIEEFLAMKKQQKQDAPVSAKVRVLNLTPKQVLEALKRARDDENLKHHTAAKNLLRIFENGANENLLEVLRTPFYFTAAMEIFDREIPNDKDLPKSVAESKTRLIEKFVERRLKSQSNPNFESEKTKKWLKWLAKLMESKQLVAFELADLQPTDLAKKWKFSLVMGAVVSLVFSLITFLVIGWTIGLIVGLGAGLVTGLVLGLLIVRLSPIFYEHIATEDVVNFDFSKPLNINYWKKLLNTLLFSMFLGFLFSLLFGLYSGLFISLVLVLGVCLEGVKKIENVTYLQSPYQRLYGGFFFQLFFAFALLAAFAVFAFLLGNSDLDYRLKSMRILLLFMPLVIIVETVLYRHSILRFCLYLENKMPLKYATFLDYAASLRILEKDGGQWRFRHQNLQEYFAELDSQTKAS